MSKLILIPFVPEHLERMNVHDRTLETWEKYGGVGITACVESGEIIAAGILIHSPVDPKDGILSIYTTENVAKWRLAIARMAKKTVPVLADLLGVSRVYATVTDEWLRWAEFVGLTPLRRVENPFRHEEIVTLCERKFHG